MAQQYVAFLPALREDAAVSPDRAGAWIEEDAGFLPRLAKSLASGGTAGELGHIGSVPDIWARPLLFQMALLGDPGAEELPGLHESVLGEWRCLLAMLALKDMRHLELRAEAVPIAEDQGPLGQALRALAPRETIDPATSWLDMYALSYRGTPIAMTSPTTLVAAAADYGAAFAGSLPEPWSRDGRTLSDPMPLLAGEERAALHAWLGRLLDGLREGARLQGQASSAACLALLRRLDEYREELAAQGLAPHGDISFVPAELGLYRGVFRLLDATARGRAGTAEDSCLRLLPGARKAQDHALLLVSPGLARDFAERLGVPAAQLTVWPGVAASDITEELLQGDQEHLGRIPLTGARRCRPEDFFLERMAVMEPGNALKGARQIPGADALAGEELSVLLPFRRELLHYFTAQEIAARTRIENAGEEIRVQFSFPLSGTGGQGTDCPFARSYPKKELVYLQTNVPVIEIWPNFRCEGWNRYYLYYENTEAQKGNLQEPGRDFFYVEPWPSGAGAGSGLPPHGLANRYTARLGAFPEALLCTVNQSVPGTPAPRLLDAGMLLLREPPRVQQGTGAPWRIGIDFGTSSTMICFRNGARPPEPLAFEPNLFQVTESGVVRLGTFENFIPSYLGDRRGDGSFLSVFHLLRPPKEGDELRPLLDGHVFWLTSNANTVTTFRNLASRIDSNLKWKNDDAGRRKVAAYVKQICLQSLAEAVLRGAGAVEWNFSYPTAFSGEQRAAFLATCEEAVAEAYEGTGLEPPAAVEPWPESKAAAYCFNHMEGRETSLGNGAVCLDIGAGTTDISFISGQPGRIVYHTSIQFAGRSLFLPIYRNYALLGGAADLGAATGEHRQAILDADMREHGDACLRNLKNITGLEEVKAVLQLSQFAMAGLFRYLGMLLSVLRAKGAYEEGHPPEIYAGGNGSRIFSWIAGGSFRPGSPFLEPVKDALLAASGLPGGFGIHLGSHPKLEVASGMIEDRPLNDRDFHDEGRQLRQLFGEGAAGPAAGAVLAGEACRSGSGQRARGEFLTATDISAGVAADRLEELEALALRFNRSPSIWADGVPMGEALLQDIRKRVNGYYVARKGSDPKKVFVEPVFVVGLRTWMEAACNGA